MIAALTQLDRLHAGLYFKKNPYPTLTCVSRVCVDVDAINNEINAKATAAEREAARTQAVAMLLRFRAEEEILAQRLETAQNSHLNDVQAMESFFQSIYSRYRNVFSYDTMIAEFATVTGKTMKGLYDLWHDLVPDYTYYYTGTGNWVRKASSERANLVSAIELISGKIPEYYLMLDLYNRMATDKSYYLGLSEAEFNALMTDTTIKRDSYISTFQIKKVWGVDYPAWQLAMKTNVRQNDLNSEKRYGTIPSHFTWAIRGTVATPEGKGVPGVSVILTGYLTVSTGDAQANFIATPVPVPVPGYSVTGRLAYENGNGVAGATVVMTTITGTERTALTGPEGNYTFPEVATGTYTVQPAVSALKYFPPKRTAVVPASVSGADFLVLRGPAGNLNGDRWIDLTDAIMALQIAVGITPEPPPAKEADVNGNGRISMAEALYILQILAGLR